MPNLTRIRADKVNSNDIFSFFFLDLEWIEFENPLLLSLSFPDSWTLKKVKWKEEEG